MRGFLAATTAVLLVLAGCGDDDEPAVTATQDESPATSAPATSAPATSAPATSAPAADADVAVAETSLGEILVDGEGMTLYLFTADSPEASTCIGGCAQTWPPLTVDGEPVAGEGVDQAELGTIERDDGSTQVTYAGNPLYTYAPDEEPGDVNGQGIGGKWWVVGPDGEAIEGEATTTTASGASTGGGLGY